ncbi:bifunctional hydroxymethylpyrimidine kinase/phosphomethylpyrimidine kinase [Methanoplanus endosymbiosus]|uniref:Bifunctional hydroxymethylpyrimidine kinase/phosphomethylpyrimidine kinase n=1 Tax=Methanoplanus endosymbiosus TaxID=33865 RepID=A0A9E7TH27_9EURY|nr:bifunctional hydroxymethylpyrimidine kinase/phosphomethylpyrimidine kinase [Methanoplanus endosymbiosus]UUX92097.1 bifunctional hydroxymethylpyrimidine kinase/phosphomethylpyrimidine kinase [Methanoplanus endosymbiosus]
MINYSKIPAACSIAGSDSGGGAGIQADLKTFSSLGVWGCTVVTAVTAQNSREVRGIWNLSAEAVGMQIQAVRDDFGIKVYKTGMLPDGRIIEAVSENIPGGVPLIIDPVMVSTSGSRLIDEDAVAALMEVLIPKSALVTPNIPEAAVLSGIGDIAGREDMVHAGRVILDMGAGAVLIKGGHLKGDVSADILVEKERVTEFSSGRLAGDFHGTGCCLSSAIAAYMAKGMVLPAACRSAKNFINSAISEPFRSDSGRFVVNPALHTNVDEY